MLNRHYRHYRHDGLSSHSEKQLLHARNNHSNLLFDDCTDANQEIDVHKILAEVIERELERMRCGEDTRFIRNGELTILGDANWSVTLKAVVSSETGLSTFPLVSQMWLMSGRINSRLHEYEHVMRQEDFSFGAPQIPEAPETILQAEDRITIDGRRDAISLKFTQAVFFRINTNLHHDVVWHYDEYRRATHATSNVEGAPGLAALISCCEGMGSQTGSDILESLCVHPSFDVRWRAFQALGNADGVRAITFKDRFLSDPNPMIRKAAERTFATLEE